MGERGENVLEFPPIEVIPGAEEAGTEDSGLRRRFGEGLSDGRLARSRQPIEPEDVFVLWILGPLHDPVEDGSSSSAKAGVMMTSFVSCVEHGIQLYKQLVVSCFLVIDSVSIHPSASLEPSHDDVLCTLVDPLCSFVDLIRRFVDPICGLVDTLDALVNALL